MRNTIHRLTIVLALALSLAVLTLTACDDPNDNVGARCTVIDDCTPPLLCSNRDATDLSAGICVYPEALPGNPQQNTDTHRVRIHYPFHPLVGQSFWIRESRRGPPPTLNLEAENGETFNVATWMTRESAADICLEDSPRLSVRTLLELVVLIRKGLESLGRQGDILPSDQTKENVHVSQATPAVVVSRSTETATTPTSRHSRKKRRHHGADASASDPQSAPGKGGA